MGTLGCGFSLIAVVFAVVGLVPFLGWLNWITTLPLALLAVAFSGLALIRGTLDRAAAAAGLAGGVLLVFWAMFRLTIGGGVI